MEKNSAALTTRLCLEPEGTSTNTDMNNLPFKKKKEKNISSVEFIVRNTAEGGGVLVTPTQTVVLVCMPLVGLL